VFPCGTDRPWASNLNFVAGQTVSNEVLVRPGADGAVCVYTTVSTQLVVDLDATFEAEGTASFTPFVAGRLADTRAETKLIGGQVLEYTALAADEDTPAGATAVTLNVAVTEPEAAGFLTVYPCGSDKPWASNLNFAAGQTISNHVTATLGEGGKVCVYSSQTTNVVIDVEGAYMAT
jgi:autotransporter family porin